MRLWNYFCRYSFYTFCLMHSLKVFEETKLKPAFFFKKMYFWINYFFRFPYWGIQSSYIILPIYQLLLLGEKCMNCKKTCFKISKRIFRTFSRIVFLKRCKSLELLPKASSTKDCVSESHQKNLRKYRRMEWMNWTERAVICCCRNIVRNGVIVLLCLWNYLGKYRFYTFYLMRSFNVFEET